MKIRTKPLSWGAPALAETIAKDYEKENVSANPRRASSDDSDSYIGAGPDAEFPPATPAPADGGGSYSLLEGERLTGEYKTLAECTFGLPRYQVAFTNLRLIIRERLQFLGLCGSESEHTVFYRDVVNARIGSRTHRWPLAAQCAAVVLLLLGLAATGAFTSPRGLGAVALAAGALLGTLTAAHLLRQHIIEGVDVAIDVKPPKAGMLLWSFLGCASSSTTFVVRLPADQAHAAVKMLMWQPKVGLLRQDEMV